MRLMRVALIADAPDWHARAMLRAFADARIDAALVRLADCRFATDAPNGLVTPGFGGALPDFVFVREIAGGSFEAVTRRLGILHALRELGVRVCNDAHAIERCVDKSTTSFLLANAGLPTPPSWAVEGADAARALVAREAGPLVLKPLFGSQGRGLRLIRGLDDLPPPETVAQVYYLQRYLPPGPEGFRDHRLFVCGGAVIGAMTRRAESWITNIKRGGKAERLLPDAELVSLARRATEAVGADCAGVDLIRDRAGRSFVLEVNSMPGWRGLQRVTDGSIAERIVAALLVPAA